MAKRTRKLKAPPAVVTWVWRSGGPPPRVNPNVFADELQRLAGDNAVELVPPEAIVEAARPRSSRIHAAFDWNIEKAAEKHWLDHARNLVGRLQTIRVQVEAGPPISTRGWWSVSIAGNRGYASESRIMGERDLRVQTIATAKRELHQLIAKYVIVLAHIGNVVPRLQTAVEEIQDEVDRLEQEATTRRPHPGSTGPQPHTLST